MYFKENQKTFEIEDFLESTETCVLEICHMHLIKSSLGKLLAVVPI